MTITATGATAADSFVSVQTDIARLDSGCVGEMLRLQRAAADGQTIPRTRKDLEFLFRHGDMAFGATDAENRLIAQAILRYGTPLPGILHNQFSAAARGGNHQALIGSVLVHPAHRGKGLMGKLLSACLGECRAHGLHDAHARVRIGNDSSLSNFLKRGFNVLAVGPSPENQANLVHFMHLKL